MPEHMNKPAVAASLGIELVTGEGSTRPSQSKHGAEIVRRAAYGKVTADSLMAFLEAYMECGHKARSAVAAGLSYSSILKAEHDDPDFAEEVEQAKALFIGKIRKQVMKVALEGWKKPIFDAKGNHVGDEWKFSERMLEILCRMDPELRDKVEVDQKVSGGVLVVQAPALSMDDWKKQVQQARGAPRELIDQPATPILPVESTPNPESQR